MTSSEYIKNLLLFNGKVTLPGLGTLELVKESARLKDKRIIPPGTGISFNPGLTLDDGKLAQSIASSGETDIEEARQKALELVDKILFSLHKGEAFTFEGIGKLYKDENDVFRFEKDPGFIVDFDSFGLESFELEPQEEEVVSEEAHPEEIPETTHATTEEHPVIQSWSEEKPEIEPKLLKEKDKRSILWYVLGSILFIFAGLVILNLTTDLLDNLTSKIFHSRDKDSITISFRDESPEVTDDLEKVPDSLSVIEKDFIPEKKVQVPLKEYQEVTGSYKEYHIIAGSFRDTANAWELAHELAMKGYPVLMLEQENDLYRVSALRFQDKETGMNELARFRAQTRNNAAWLLGLDQ